MDRSPLALSAEIISQADREHPADSVLRFELKRCRGLPRAQGREVSQAVFAYFRWLGWLPQVNPLPHQIHQAIELNSRFKLRPETFRDDELVSLSAPDWTKKHFEMTPALARAMQTEPKLWLRARPGQAGQLAVRLGDCSAVSFPESKDALVYEGAQDLFRTPEFHAGEFELQDISSQAVGWLCAPKPGEIWWDACAGEGGKTLHLSDLMQNQGLIWASDRAAWRLQRLKRRAARAKVFNYRAVEWTGGATPPTKTKFDGVLLDAPCSGTGTWQRNPHARWTTTEADVEELAGIQRQLLGAVAKAVKPGGKLIYAVCALTRAETIEVTAAFARQHPDFQALPVANPFQGDLPNPPELWLMPQHTGGNGMFVAAWQRGPKRQDN